MGNIYSLYLLRRIKDGVKRLICFGNKKKQNFSKGHLEEGDFKERYLEEVLFKEEGEISGMKNTAITKGTVKSSSLSSLSSSSPSFSLKDASLSLSSKDASLSLSSKDAGSKYFETLDYWGGRDEKSIKKMKSDAFFSFFLFSVFGVLFFGLITLSGKLVLAIVVLIPAVLGALSSLWRDYILQNKKYLSFAAFLKLALTLRIRLFKRKR
jgi:hypothetical protein